MNINQLESYNLADAVKFHDTLNPVLWDRRENLHPEIHDQLMAIATDFGEFIGVKDLNLTDITISGSNAAFSYTPHSDIDLHLIVDLSNVEHEDVYRELFSAKKAIYNKENTITIKGIPVEVYVQDATQEHHSQGIYSILNSSWIQIPRRVHADIDDVSVRSKYQDLSKRIKNVIKTDDLAQMNDLMDKIRLMRSTGLSEKGEFGPENLAFKILRNKGDIKKLNTARQAAKDQQLSLKERVRTSAKYGYGKDYIEEVELTPDGTNPTTAQFTNEEKSDDKSTIKDFMEFCADQLGIDKDISLRIRRDPQWSVRNKTFGRYNDGTKELEVGIGGRHIMDVLRTVAHELVHQKQNEHEQVPANAGEDGSEYENEANAQAGVLMRQYGKLHPELFATGIESSSTRDINETEHTGGTRLKDLATVATNMPDADFWLIRKGSDKTVGTPVKEFTPERIGVKIVRTDVLDPTYLYYAMMHLHNKGYFARLAVGTLKLVNIKVSDVANISFGGQGVSESSLNESQTLSTDEFKRWFAGSKVVDAMGKPIVLYHGTNQNIAIFKLSKEGALGKGIYMTPDPAFASEYAMTSAFDIKHKSGNNVLPLYAKIVNPVEITYVYGRDMAELALRALGVSPEKASDMVEKAYEVKGNLTNEIFSRAVKLGHDGILYYDEDGTIREAVAFSANQIKSVYNRSPSDSNNISTESQLSEFAPSSGNSDDELKLEITNISGESDRNDKFFNVYEFDIYTGDKKIGWCRAHLATGKLKGSINLKYFAISLKDVSEPLVKQALKFIRGHQAGKPSSDFVDESAENNNSDTEHRDKLKSLLRAGKDRGYIFQKEITKAFPEITTDDIASLSDQFEKMGIVVYTHEPDDNDSKPAPTQTKISGSISPSTPEFKKWFAGSKVVDTDGNPLRVYHAAPKGFEGSEFKSPKVMANNGGNNPSGYYFSPRLDDANMYVKHHENTSSEYETGAQIIPAYLSIKNPYIRGVSIMSAPMSRQYYKELIAANQHMSDEKLKYYADSKVKSAKGTQFPKSDYVGNNADALKRIIEAGGFDGILDGAHWVAFYPNQIKSVYNQKPSDSNNISTEGLNESTGDNTVTRIDSKPIKDFGVGLQTYYHTPDWSQSGQFPAGEKIPKKFSGKVTGLYAGDPHFTALYATGNANQTRYVAKYSPGQPIVYLDRKDVPRIRKHHSYLSVFDATNFKKMPSGEYFSENPGNPIEQTEITDPFQYMRDQGWEWKIVDDLKSVLKKLKKEKAKYGAEGMGFAESRINEASGYIPNPQDIPQNIWNLYQKHERITAMANERIPSEPNAKGVYPRPQDLKREQTMSFRRLFNAVEKFTGDTSGDPSGSTMQMLTRLSELSRAENEKDVEEGVDKHSKNTYLWHGSRHRNEVLIPRQATDTGGSAGSNQNAIYATSNPKVAIAMGLTTSGSDTGMFPNDPQMVLFSGKIRKGENVYLHKLPMNGPDGKPQFVQGGNSREFHSIPSVQSIKPIEIKEVPVDKNLNLIRQATPADLELQKKYMKQGVAEDLNEASGYIPTAAEAHDPRYEMALTVDVRPGALGKAANSFLLNTDSQGHPQELRPDGLVQRMTEELALFKKKPTMKIHELIFESKKTYTLGGFPVKPIHIENQEVGEAIKIDAPQKPWAKQDIQDYLNRIKTDTKTKRDRFNPIIHGSNIKAIVKADGTSEWDLDDLKNQITTPPQSLFGKNAKMIKGEKEGTITYDLTLPALSGMVVDEETGEFVEITTCPGAEECQHYCYARKGGYVMFPDSSMSSARALNFLVNHPKEYMAMFDSEVKQAKIKAKKNNVKLEVRIHDAGDYFSKEYWNLSKQVQNANPDANFYFYSKNGDIITDPDKPANTLANFSANGAQKREINKVDTYKSAGNNVKGTLVIPKDMFRDLFVTDAKGKYIKDEAGRTQVKSNKAWTQFKQQLASKYNVDPKSIITYDQMVKKKEPRPIGKKDKLMSDGTVKKVPVYAPAKWNVVVFPAGHGDLGATRHDVQNQFLMFH